MGIFKAQSNLTGKIYPFEIVGNTPTEEESALISSYIVDRERPEPEVDESDESSIFSQGFGRGVDLIQKNLGSAIEGFGEVTGIQSVKDYGAEVVERNEQELAENSDKAKRLDDIKDIGSFFDWTASTFGEQLPNLGYTLGGAGTGAAAGSFFGPVGTVAGGIIGGIGANLPFFYGGNREAQKEEIEKGNRIEVSESAAFLSSTLQAPLDFIADRLLISGFTGKLLAGGGLFTKGVKASEVAGSAAKGIAAGTVIEVPTELGQQVIERYQAGKSLTSDEAIDEYKEVAAAAGLLGGTVRGTGQTLFGQKPPAKSDDKLSQLKNDQRLLRDQKTQEKINADKIIADLDLKAEDKTVEKVNQSETKTKDLLDAAKETQSPYQPIKLSDLDPVEAQKIRLDRINVNREQFPSDTDADTTVEEVEVVLGEKAANNQKVKQKPNLAFKIIQDLDNELVNLDGAIESEMKDNKKLQKIIKDSKEEEKKAEATEKLEQSKDKLTKLTEAKQVKEKEYTDLINTYISRKQAKNLDNLQYPNTASAKASPEVENIAAMNNFEPTREYLAKQSRIQDNLQKELNEIGLSDVKLKVAPMAFESDTQVTEGLFTSEGGQRTIALSMALYNSDMSEAALTSKLRSVMNHEIIHAIRDLGIIKPEEFKTLVNAARKRNYVVIENGKPVVRKYTYMDRAIEMNRELDNEAKAEEAVAEMFRDWSDGKLTLVGQPKTLFQKIVRVIKAIFGAHQQEGFTRADEIFANIKTTDKEKQIGARQRGTIGPDKQQQSAIPIRKSDTPLKIDNPVGVDFLTGETYVEKKIRQNNEYKERLLKDIPNYPQDTYEMNIGTAEGATAFIDGVVFNPKELANIRGSMGEEKFRENDDILRRLQESIAKKGYLPDTIMIHVREDGVPFVVEGNHRIVEAVLSNRPEIKTDIRYLRGAEKADGPLNPQRIGIAPAKFSAVRILTPDDFIYKEGDYEKQNIETRTDLQKEGLFEAMGEDGALLEYEDVGVNLQEYITNNNRDALQRALTSPQYDEYYQVLQANLKRAFPSGQVKVMRLENYVEIQTGKDKNKKYSFNEVGISEIAFVGAQEERELVVVDTPRSNKSGVFVGENQLLSHFMSKNQRDIIPRRLKSKLKEYESDIQTPYNENVQEALTQYARGNLSAKDVRKVLKKEGYQFDPIGLRTGLPEINVYPSNDKMKKDEIYAPQVYSFSAVKTDKVANALLEFIQTNPDGFTIDIDVFPFVEQQAGIAVAPSKPAEIRVSDKVIDKDMVYRFAETVALMAKLGDVKMFAGGWRSEDGLFNLDATMLVDDNADALYIGEAADQDGIFNLSTFEFTGSKDGIQKLKEANIYDSEAHDQRRRFVSDLTEQFTKARDRGEIERRVRDIKRAQKGTKRRGARKVEKFSAVNIAPEVDDNGMVTLTHFSPVSDLIEIRPDQQGTNDLVAGSESKRRDLFPDRYLPRNYYGMAVGKPYGYKPENIGDNVYEAKVPIENLYNMDEDGLDYMYKAAMEAGDGFPQTINTDREKNLLAQTIFENLVKEDGFIGYYGADTDLGMVASIFQPLSVKPAKEKKFSAVPLPGGATDIARYLLKNEYEYVYEGIGSNKRVSDLYDLFTKYLPTSNEMANVAISGVEKKGWYKNSAQTIQDLFGIHDGRRFVALLAAMSPQISVETNLQIALKTWVAWNLAGRPRDPAAIDDLAYDAIEGRYMSTIHNNTQRSLSADDGQEMALLLSGPKVNSFMLNLVNNVMEVTNDSWMTNYAAIDIDPKVFQKKLKRSNPTKREILEGRGQDDIAKIAGKSIDYIALSAKTREAAEVATQLTGERWTPAEIQETVWSVTRALGNLRRVKGQQKSARELLEAGEVTNVDISQVEDFATLMSEGIYQEILERGGYGERLRTLKPAETGRLDPREERSILRVENRKINPSTFRRELLTFADRLETNITTERINKKFSKIDVQPEFDLVRSPEGKQVFGMVLFGGKPLHVLLPVGRHFNTEREKAENLASGDRLGNFGLRHIQSDRQGVLRKTVNHEKDLLNFTNYKSVEDAIFAVLKKINEKPNLEMRNGKFIGYTDNFDYEFTEDRERGQLTFDFKPSSKVNNRKSGIRRAPFKLILQKGVKKAIDPTDTSGLPPEDSFNNPNIKDGTQFMYVKTFYNQDPKFSAVPVQEIVPPNASDTDNSIRKREEEIRYNNLAPMLTKPLKILFDADKAEAIAERTVVRFQDAFQPVGKMIDALRNQGLSIANALDPYLKEKMFHGYVKDLNIKAYENFYTPMGELIKKINVDQASLDALEATKGTIAFRVYKDNYPDIRLALADLYLYARHAKSRNEFVRKKTGRAIGSSMSDSEADIYLNWFNNLEDNSAFAEIASLAKQITDDTTNKRRQAGLIPEAEEEAFNELVNYVPLRGDISQDQEIDEDTGEAIVPRTIGTFFGARGRPDKTIKGRVFKDASYAENIIPTLMSQNNKTIELSERNKVGLSFLSLLNGRDVSPNGELTESTDLKENMRAIARVLDPEEVKKLNKDEKALHLINVRQDGKDISIYINDANIARAMKVHYSPTNMSGIVRAMSQINRFLSNVNTSWNPSFVIPNLAKDLETAGVNVQQYGEQGITKEIMYNAFKAINGIRKNLRNGDKESEWSKEYLLFRENGGQNATNQMGDLDTQIKNLKEVLDGIGEDGRFKRLGQMKKKFVGGRDSILKFLDDYNTAVENGVRVATFRALRNRGMSIERAAEASRDITVNFAKGGEDKAFMNAWFLFYNASLQGSMALFNAAVRSKRVQKFWAGLFVYGFLNDQLIALFAEDEDEDGISDYDELSRYELEHNLIIPNFGLDFMEDRFIKIPLAYGLNMAVNTGRALSRAFRGEYTAGEATESILATATEMINPLGGTESFLNFVSPTVADPFVSLYINKDYKGDPITKDSPTFTSRPLPDAHSHWNTTGEIPKSIAQFINDLSGGNEVRSGLVDLSPDTLQFWFDYISGGAGRFVLRSGETIFNDVPEILSGDFEGKIVPRIPLARKVIATPSEIADTGTYLENRKELFTIFAELDIARRAGDTERIKDVTDKYRDELRVYGRIKAIDNARNRLLRQIKKIERNPRLEEERKKQLIKNIRKKINEFQKNGLIIMRSAGIKEAG